MALRIKCPECKALNRIDEDDRGRRIRCQECDERFRVPEEDSDDRGDDRPRKKKKKQPAGASHLALYLVLGGAGLFLLLFTCIGGVGLFLILHNANQPPNFPVDVARGKIILDRRDAITLNDPPDPRRQQSRMKVHQVHMQAGKTYFIAMNSNTLDPYLRLETPNGQNIAEDDDGGGNLNALIVHRATQTGMHRVIATTCFGGTGQYQVIVQEAN